MLMFGWDKEDMRKHLWTLSCEPATLLIMPEKYYVHMPIDLKVNVNFFAWKRMRDTQFPSKL